MPDIMMCAAKNCSMSSQCYRHADSGTEPCEHRQCYWLRDDNSPSGPDCRNFWKRTPLVAAAHDGTF